VIFNNDVVDTEEIFCMVQFKAFGHG